MSAPNSQQQQQAKPKQQQVKPKQQQQQQQQPKQQKPQQEPKQKQQTLASKKTDHANQECLENNRIGQDTTIVAKPTTVPPPPVAASKMQERERRTSVSNANSNSEFVSAPVTLQLTSKKQKPNDSMVTKFKLFNHLQPNSDFSVIEKLSFDNSTVHPAFLKLGLQYANGIVSGSNSRCLKFLIAFKEFVRDYKFPKDFRDINKDLEAKLKPNINYLAQCRPMSVSMGNVIKEFKQRISQLRNDMTEEMLKSTLYEEIDNFGEERVKLAGQTICKYLLAHEDVVISGSSYVKSKLTNNDCILIYGYSSLVIQVIRAAHRQFKSLRVVVVDARPKKSGKKALKELLDIGVDCTYIHINAVSFVMKLVTKVILGSHALLANGYVMSSAGASQIALIAKSFNVPVVVCCETYKFCDKVQTDAFINNELGNAKELLRDLPSTSPLPALWSPNTPNSNINVINLIYDVTPPDLITCVVTDMGMLPCTSVPVVLRVKNRDNCNYSQDKNILLAEQTHKFAELSMKA